MHEMGIVSSVLDAVRTEVNRLPGSRATRVGLRVGEWAGVDVESIRFCFEALVMDSDLSGMQLEIDYCLRENGCKGDELDVAFVELEE